MSSHGDPRFQALATAELEKRLERSEEERRQLDDKITELMMEIIRLRKNAQHDRRESENKIDELEGKLKALSESNPSAPTDSKALDVDTSNAIKVQHYKKLNDRQSDDFFRARLSSISEAKKADELFKQLDSDQRTLTEAETKVDQAVTKHKEAVAKRNATVKKCPQAQQEAQKSRQLNTEGEKSESSATKQGENSKKAKELGSSPPHESELTVASEEKSKVAYQGQRMKRKARGND
ncbi:uncharacterized protein KY384_008170 [Bacidia gigantensis]|uniref:uncharacterized protein n=1 Tax=Bacidia gigantensis TaxID=2732470 RepID=UPI001D039323|nr:uncharacterized protein KY384_008170 [Bacidia gigantensis]KAG8526741.1 hypothetical protein KY384_008170 [Bacidia gigantensis]